MITQIFVVTAQIRTQYKAIEDRRMVPKKKKRRRKKKEENHRHPSVGIRALIGKKLRMRGCNS